MLATSLVDTSRDNQSIQIAASAARTTAQAFGPFTNFNATKAFVYLNVTAASGTGGLQVAIVGVDPVSGLNFQIGANPTAITATGKSVYVYGPGCTAATGGDIKAGVVAPIPDVFNVIVTVGDASSYTYSIGMSVIQ